MNTSLDNNRISSTINIEYPDFEKTPAHVRKKFDAMPTKVNFFRMLGHSVGTFVPVIDLTNAIFKDLTISDYFKELAVLVVGAHSSTVYEWEQHVTIAQVAGVRQDQFVAIAENQLNDVDAFNEKERIFLRFVKTILEKDKAPGVLLKHVLQYFSLQEIADAMIVLGYYRMLAGFINTFEIESDPQKDGGWVKG